MRHQILHAVLAELPSGSLQQRRNTAISAAAILAGEFNNNPRQRIFIVAQNRLMVLPVALLMNQTARTSLAPLYRACCTA